MKRFKTIGILLLAIHFFFIAEGKIEFRQIKYSEVFDQAKKENKNVMLYFHFDGCGSCVKMENSAFLDEKVSEFYNSNFICFEVNTRAGEGIETNKIYNVYMHPTFLYLNSDGKIQHKIVGSFSSADFLAEGQNALTPDKTLSYYQKEYLNGNRTPDFLFDYCYKLRNADELDSVMINQYIITQADEDFKKEKNIRFIYEFMMYNTYLCLTSNSPAYRFMSNHKELFKEYFDTDQIEARLMFILDQEADYAAEERDSVKFNSILEKLRPFNVDHDYEYKEMDGRTTGFLPGKTIVVSAQMMFYNKVGDSARFNLACDDCLKILWDDSDLLNEFAWGFYEHQTDPQRLEKAIKSIRRAIELKNSYEYNDTYACLLYKTGKYTEALRQAEAAIALAKENQVDFKPTSDLVEKIKEAMKEGN